MLTDEMKAEIDKTVIWYYDRIPESWLSISAYIHHNYPKRNAKYSRKNIMKLCCEYTESRLIRMEVLR